MRRFYWTRGATGHDARSLARLDRFLSRFVSSGSLSCLLSRSTIACRRLRNDIIRCPLAASRFFVFAPLAGMIFAVSLSLVYVVPFLSVLDLVECQKHTSKDAGHRLRRVEEVEEVIEIFRVPSTSTEFRRRHRYTPVLRNYLLCGFFSCRTLLTFSIAGESTRRGGDDGRKRTSE